MGVCGSGKSAIARRLAKRIRARYVEADKYHPESNVEKMSQSMPLDDNDREPWLKRLNQVLLDCETADCGVVLACSALKERYRETLRQHLRQSLMIVFLQVDQEELQTRVGRRKRHFMPADLLDSQMATLEPPADAFVPDGDHGPDQQVETIVRWLAVKASVANKK
jgi:carbohydrate kinase (thermoresistant glucokinase family)